MILTGYVNTRFLFKDFDLSKGLPLNNFEIGHGSYQLREPTGRSNLVHGPFPMGVQMAGGWGQFLVFCYTDGGMYEALIYWYRRIEGDLAVVVDTLKEVHIGG